jgi:hypothetical protein
VLNNNHSLNNLACCFVDVLTIPNDKKKAEVILIVSYMRSGSTFTADILQQSAEVFYLFEPFKPTRSYFKANALCNGYTGKCR